MTRYGSYLIPLGVDRKRGAVKVGVALFTREEAIAFIREAESRPDVLRARLRRLSTLIPD